MCNLKETNKIVWSLSYEDAEFVLGLLTIAQRDLESRKEALSETKEGQPFKELKELIEARVNDLRMLITKSISSKLRH